MDIKTYSNILIPVIFAIQILCYIIYYIGYKYGNIKGLIMSIIICLVLQIIVFMGMFNIKVTDSNGIIIDFFNYSVLYAVVILITQIFLATVVFFIIMIKTHDVGLTISIPLIGSISLYLSISISSKISKVFKI